MNMPAPIGHNFPPRDDEILQEKLAEKNEALLARHSELLAAVDRLPAKCDDDEMAGKLGDMIKLLMHCEKTLETNRVGEKEPFLTLGRVVDGFFKKYTSSLDTAKAKVNRVLTPYLKWKEDEARRVAREQQQAQIKEAQRLADEAAAQDAAKMKDAATQTLNEAAAMEKQAAKTQETVEAKAADLTRTRGDMGSVSGLVTKWVADQIDYETIDLEALRPFLSRAEIDKAAQTFARTVRNTKSLRGATIHEVSEARVR